MSESFVEDRNSWNFRYHHSERTVYSRDNFNPYCQVEEFPSEDDLIKLPLKEDAD